MGGREFSRGGGEESSKNTRLTHENQSLAKRESPLLTLECLHSIQCQERRKAPQWEPAGEDCVSRKRDVHKHLYEQRPRPRVISSKRHMAGNTKMDGELRLRVERRRGVRWGSRTRQKEGVSSLRGTGR